MAQQSIGLPPIVPAQLSFLGIYNPELGPTDETFKDQVVYWYSRAAEQRRRRSDPSNDPDGKKEAEALKEEENEKLRQIGLAQGIIGFARNFADGQPADTVDTDKSRFVIQELESGWWIIVAIDFTRITTRGNVIKGQDPLSVKTEYSSKEVSPSAILSKQLEKANKIFLLHNGQSLSDLYVRLSRVNFCKLLGRFWDNFTSDWDVLLHASPAVDVFSGIKLSAGGELGMGVGEEEWGSGERDVLEGLINETEGCVDIVVARYGDVTLDEPQSRQSRVPSSELTSRGSSPWLGVAAASQASDGIVFAGRNNVTRKSLKDISDWMDWVHIYGESAYGVKDNPRSGRRPPRPTLRQTVTTSASIKDHSTRISSKEAERTSSYASTIQPGIPPPIVSAAERALDKATQAADKTASGDSTPPAPSQPDGKKSDTWMKILTFGLVGSTSSDKKAGHSNDLPDKPVKTSRSRRGSKASVDARVVDQKAEIREVDPMPDVDRKQEKIQDQINQEIEGYFLIGLKGELGPASAQDGDGDFRIPLRTMYVETIAPEPTSDDDSSPIQTPNSFAVSPPVPKKHRLRVLVYVQRPFIYTLLFKLGTDNLQLSSFYRHLHTFFNAMHRGLNMSTSPDRVAHRLRTAGGTYSTSSATARPSANDQAENKTSSNHFYSTDNQPIFDLLYDPQSLNVHANLPSIPYPGTLAAEALTTTGAANQLGWTRADALNVHSAIIEVLEYCRRNGTTESSAKTSRGWWIVYLKIDVRRDSVLSNDDGISTPKAGTSQVLEGAADVAKGLVEAISAPAPTERVWNPSTSLRSSTTSTHPKSRSGKSSTSTSVASPLQRRVLSPTRKDSDPNRTARTPPSTSSYFPPSSPSRSTVSSMLKPPPALYREAILVRRARDGLTSTGRGTDSRNVSGAGGAGGLWSFATGGGSGKDAASGWGPARLAEGVGVDAKRYVEGLIGLGR